MPIVKTGTASNIKQKLARTNKKKADDQIVTDDPAANAAAPDTAPANAETALNAWLEETRQDQAGLPGDEEHLARQEAGSTQAIHLADASSSSPTTNDAGKSLGSAAQPAGEAATAGETAVSAGTMAISPAMIATIGAVAVAAASGGASAAAIAAVTDGIVIDGPVQNALVFRDSDGDGKWKDVDGDGIWEAGDEYIVTTGSDGTFTGLAGTGQIVAVGLDRLISTNGSGVDKGYGTATAIASVTDSQGTTVNTGATDTATGLPFTGVLVAPAAALATNDTGGDSYTITGVSSLIAHMLETAGIAAPTAQQVIEYSEMLNQMLTTTYGGGAIAAGSDAINFFQSGANDLIISLLDGIAAQAGGNSVATMEAALQELADELINGGTYDEFNPLDLTDSAALDALFDGLDSDGLPITVEFTDASGDIIDTSALIGSISSADFSTLATAAALADGVITSNSSDSVVGPVIIGGSITVTSPASSDVSSLSLTDVTFNNPTISITASSYDTSADLFVDSSTGGIASLTVEASGVSSDASADFYGSSDLVVGNVTITASGMSSDARVYFSEDSTVAFNQSNINISTTASSYDALASFEAWNAAGTINDITVSSGSSSYATALISGDAFTIGGNIAIEATDASAIASLDLFYAAFDSASIGITASGENSHAILDANDISGGITAISILASNSNSWANANIATPGADVHFTLAGPITITASGASSEADLVLHRSDFNNTVINITASGYDSIASLSEHDQTGTIQSIHVTASNYSDANISINTLTGSVQHLHLDSTSGNISADLTFDATHYVVNTEIDLSSVPEIDITTATLTINQTVHGGEVFASSSAFDSSNADFNLTYVNGTADKIYLGYLATPGNDATFVQDFDGTFNLTLSSADADLDIVSDRTALLDSMLEIWGTDYGTPDWNDTLRFADILGNSNSGNFSRDMTPPSADIDAFLSDADTALDGTVDYYFGVIGSDGYLAYDSDGTGITMLIKLYDTTDFESTRIYQPIL